MRDTSSVTPAFRRGWSPAASADAHGAEVGARMQRAAIVPHHEIASTPDVLVDEFAALLVVEQYDEQLVALLLGQTFDPYRHQAVDVKRLASSRGMRAHHRMRIGGHALREPCAALHGRR